MKLYASEDKLNVHILILNLYEKSLKIPEIVRLYKQFKQLRIFKEQSWVIIWPGTFFSTKLFFSTRAIFF